MELEEKFKYMGTGNPYNDLDHQLVLLRNEATFKTNIINQENDDQAKELLFQDLFGNVGINPVINPNFRCEFGKNIHIGDYFYANYDCVILDGASVEIGNSVMFGPKVGIYTSNHLYNSLERISGGCIAKPIIIGDSCWLAANVTVLPGVTIGENTIIGAGSVVTHDIPAGVIAAGNPCKVIRPIDEGDNTGFTGNSFSL